MNKTAPKQSLEEMIETVKPFLPKTKNTDPIEPEIWQKNTPLPEDAGDWEQD